MHIKEIMKSPHIITKDTDLRSAAKIMSEKNIGCLLFCSGKKIKGIITERDLLRNFSKGGKISEHMTSNVITAGPNEDLSKALLIMKDNNIKRLPVVGEKKELIGIITLTDLAASNQEAEGDFFF